MVGKRAILDHRSESKLFIKNRPRVNFQVNPQTGTFANFLCVIYNMSPSSAGPPIFYSKFEEFLVINMSVRKTVQPKIVSPVFNIIKCLSSFGA